MKKTKTTIPTNIQKARIKNLFKDGVFKGTRKSNDFIYELNITPTPLSKSYTIQLRYKNHIPTVYVISPMPLELHGKEKRLPHIYNQKEQRICLYYPSNDEWDSSQYLADTIIPWASEWLFHYEIWLSTGEWQGGGIHHDEEDKE